MLISSKIFQLRKLALVLFLSYSALAQTDEGHLRIAFYNLENLFHPDNDSLKNDEEFTPEGARHWTYWRYQQKLNQMAKAVLSLGEWDPPAIVGLEEVECRQVLTDMLATPVLNKIPYRIIHYESPDKRGVDVALIYRRDLFELLYSKALPVKMADDPSFATRDMLYVKGIAGGRDTLHIVVCHWPSRYSGQMLSEPKRIAAARVLLQLTDSLFSTHTSPLIIVGGDFNDEPDNESMQILCSPRNVASVSYQLINLMEHHDPGTGSHRHEGHWGYLDQIIVSETLLEPPGPNLTSEGARAFAAEFLLEEDQKYPGKKPFRHFSGYQLHGGFSDHLPVYIDLQLSTELTPRSADKSLQSP